jgi:parallel beta-helix repeat protein
MCCYASHRVSRAWVTASKFDCRAVWGDTSVSLLNSTRRHCKSMKKIARLLPLAALLLTSLPCAAQGPLTPPGPPAPTMKTLEQIEPRTPISSADYVIFNSGSYYLTSNLTGVALQNGITVNADDVTIDLNGFTLIGSGATSGHGIYQASALRNLRVHNGKVVQWRGASKGGVYASGKNNQFDHIQAATNSYGIYAGAGCTISDCSAYYNSDDGIETSAESTISGCTARYNTGDGIQTGNGSTISGNTCGNNGTGGNGAGILVTAGNNRIDSNNVTHNSRGIDVNMRGNLIIRNSASENVVNYDIVADNRVGVIVFAPNNPAISGDAGGVGVGTTDPWANFSF